MKYFVYTVAPLIAYLSAIFINANIIFFYYNSFLSRHISSILTFSVSYTFIVLTLISIFVVILNFMIPTTQYVEFNEEEDLNGLIQEELKNYVTHIVISMIISICLIYSLLNLG